MNDRTSPLVIQILALVALSSAASAESEPDPQSCKFQNLVAKAGGKSSANALLQSSNGSGTGSFTLTLGGEDFDRCDSENKRRTQDKYVITASAPVQSGNKLTDFANLDGLANSISLKFEYRQFSLSDQVLTSISGLCDAGGNGNQIMKFAKLRDRLSATPSGNSCLDIHEDLQKLGYDGLLDAANRSTDRELIRQARAYLDLIDEEDPAVLMNFWGFNGKIGYEEFDFLNSDKFASLESFQNADIASLRETTELPWSVGVHYGVALKSDWVIKSEFRYEKSYKAATSVVRCPNGVAGTAFDCVSGASTGPADKNSYIVSLKARRPLKMDWLFSRAAISFDANYDFEADVLGLEMPVYLVGDNKGNLNGGFRVGWRSDTKDPIFGIFIGSAFSLF